MIKFYSNMNWFHSNIDNFNKNVINMIKYLFMSCLLSNSQSYCGVHTLIEVPHTVRPHSYWLAWIFSKWIPMRCSTPSTQNFSESKRQRLPRTKFSRDWTRSRGCHIPHSWFDHLRWKFFIWNRVSLTFVEFWLLAMYLRKKERHVALHIGFASPCLGRKQGNNQSFCDRFS